MQADVGIGVDPVSAGRVAAIDDRDRRVGMVEQRVGERHRRGTGADHQIVRFEFFVHRFAMVVVGVEGAPGVRSEGLPPERRLAGEQLRGTQPFGMPSGGRFLR